MAWGTLAGLWTIAIRGFMGHLFCEAGLETVFVPTNPSWSYISSSLIKEVVRFGGDVSGLVPPGVADRLREALTA